MPMPDRDRDIELLAYIRAFVTERGYPPSVAEALGLPRESIEDWEVTFAVVLVLGGAFFWLKD